MTLILCYLWGLNSLESWGSLKEFNDDAKLSSRHDTKCHFERLARFLEQVGHFSE